LSGRSEIRFSETSCTIGFGSHSYGFAWLRLHHRENKCTQSRNCGTPQNKHIYS